MVTRSVGDLATEGSGPFGDLATEVSGAVGDLATDPSAVGDLATEVSGAVGDRGLRGWRSGEPFAVDDRGR